MLLSSLAKIDKKAESKRAPTRMQYIYEEGQHLNWKIRLTGPACKMRSLIKMDRKSQYCSVRYKRRSRVDDGNSLHRIFVERAAIRENKSTLTYGQRESGGGGGDDCISDEEPDIRTRPPADVVDGEAAIRISFRRPGE